MVTNILHTNVLLEGVAPFISFLVLESVPTLVIPIGSEATRIILHYPSVRGIRAGHNLPTPRTAMSPTVLGVAPLQSLGVVVCGAAVVNGVGNGEWEDTGLT